MYDLRLPPTVWRNDFPALARARGRCRADLRCIRTARTQELIVQAGSFKRGDGAGSRRRFEQSLIVEFSDSVSTTSCHAVLRDLAPTDDQLFVALVLGLGEAAGRWSAAVWHYGEILPLDALQLVGPGMLTIKPDETEEANPVDADESWSRTRGALGDGVFERVRRSRIALVGASRNGSFAAHAFAMLGVRQLFLIDPDRDERHNLPATLGAAPDGVEDWKVTNRAAALRRVRPDLTITTLNRSFPDRRTLSAIEQADLICTCTDDDLPRLAAARWANDHCRPHLDVGSGVFLDAEEGKRVAAAGDDSPRRKGLDVQLALPGEACVACLAGLRGESTAQTLLDGPPGMLSPEPRRSWQSQRAGSLPTINAIAVNLAVQAWLDLIAGTLESSLWTRVEWDSAGLPRMTHRSIPEKSCAICRDYENDRPRSN